MEFNPVTAAEVSFTIAIQPDDTKALRKLIDLLSGLRGWIMTREKGGTDIRLTFTDFRFINALNNAKISYSVVDQATLF